MALVETPSCWAPVAKVFRERVPKGTEAAVVVIVLGTVQELTPTPTPEIEKSILGSTVAVTRTDSMSPIFPWVLSIRMFEVL